MIDQEFGHYLVELECHRWVEMTTEGARSSCEQIKACNGTWKYDSAIFDKIK